MRGEFDEASSIYRHTGRTLTELGWHFNAALVSIDSGPVERFEAKGNIVRAARARELLATVC